MQERAKREEEEQKALQEQGVKAEIEQELAAARLAAAKAEEALREQQVRPLVCLPGASTFNWKCVLLVLRQRFRRGLGSSSCSGSHG